MLIQRWSRWATLTGVVFVAPAVFLPISSGAGTQVRGCTVDGIKTQICPVAFTGTVGKRASFVVAKYADLSHCNIAPPPSAPGDNGNYVVGSISINWGDGSPTTSGTARKAKGCPGTSVLVPYGATAAITGIHRYAKRGTFTVRVSIKYRRGRGNTWQNCAKVTPGDETYNILTNCIAYGAPVRSIGRIAGGHR